MRIYLPKTLDHLAHRVPSSPHMILVGHDPGIRHKAVACRKCGWQALGSKLSTKLLWLEWMRGYLCVYCCPACSSLDLAYKGKLLPFRSSPAPDDQEAEQ